MEAKIAQMGRMGFERTAALAALEANAGDIHAAITHALSAGTAGAAADARPATPPPIAGPEPEPELGPQERLLARSQEYVAGDGGSSGGGLAQALAAPVSGAADRMIDRLRARCEHQKATLSMLRAAGATEEELGVIKADVEVLEGQVQEYDDNQAAMLAAREAARAAQEAAERQRRAKQQAENDARLAAEAAAASAADASAEEQARRQEEEAQAAAAQRAADEALAAEVDRELGVAARADEITRSILEAHPEMDAGAEMPPDTDWRAEILQATTQTDEGGYEYTAYEIVVNGPEGEKKALKRYSEFEALKEKLAASDDAKETQISAIEFPAKTWTTWGANHPDTIEGRRKTLGAWLNAVLFLCPNTAAVVEFVSGEDYLLKSVRPEVATDRHS